MKFDKGDSLSYVAVIGEDNQVVLHEKAYDIAKMNFGKRGTKGKKCD